MPARQRQSSPFSVKNYPGTLLMSLAALTAAGLIESFGLAALLPVLGEITGSKASLPPPLNQWFAWCSIGSASSPVSTFSWLLVVGLLLTKIIVRFVVLGLCRMDPGARNR